MYIFCFNKAVPTNCIQMTDKSILRKHNQLPDFRDLDRTERKLYGRHADRMMKTDVHEHDDHYEVDIDLPGFKKEEIGLELNNGYLIVSANKGLDKDEKDKKGKLIRQERYSGSMQRSFYVGENITEEDIKASFKHGVLLCLRV